METFTSSCNDIDEFVCGLDNSEWQQDFVQLSPGPLKFITRVVVLPGITLFWNHFRTRIRVSESYLGKNLVFGFILNSENPLLFNGHEFSFDHGVIQHSGSEQNYIVPENIHSLILHVDHKLAMDIGLHVCNIVQQRTHKPALKALEQECRAATLAAQKLSSEVDNDVLAKTLRNNILFRLKEAVLPWTDNKYNTLNDTPPPSRDYLLFKRAEYEMHKIGLGTRPSVDQLAGMLEVSKRSLFYAFNKWVGIGPNAYFDLLRLHYVRDRLLAGNRSTMRVTEVANELGFNHLGRFSGQYFNFFGEYPYETLSKNKDI